MTDASGAQAGLGYGAGQDRGGGTAERDRRVQRIPDHLSSVRGLELGVDPDPNGCPFSRARLTPDPDVTGHTDESLTAALAEGDGADLAKAAGIGVGTAVASLIYAPLKLTYAFGGLVVGGLAWAFSGGDSSVASIIFTPSLRGDYVVTREQLLGKQEIEFFGRRPEYRSDDGWDDMPLGEEVAAATPERW